MNWALISILISIIIYVLQKQRRRIKIVTDAPEYKPYGSYRNKKYPEIDINVKIYNHSNYPITIDSIFIQIPRLRFIEVGSYGRLRHDKTSFRDYFKIRLRRGINEQKLPKKILPRNSYTEIKFPGYILANKLRIEGYWGEIKTRLGVYDSKGNAYLSKTFVTQIRRWRYDKRRKLNPQKL